MEAKEKEWLKKRVKMPDDQADGDPPPRNNSESGETKGTED